jgi:hypothetical protein
MHTAFSRMLEPEVTPAAAPLAQVGHWLRFLKLHLMTATHHNPSQPHHMSCIHTYVKGHVPH